MLKKILFERNCRPVAEERPKHICVVQGSLSGILPLSAKKLVYFHLTSEGLGTKIASSSQISSDWKNLTLYGNMVAALVAAIFVWIATDMSIFLESGRIGFWTWLAQIYGAHNPWGAFFMIKVIQALAIVLTATILIEILIVVYVYPRKNAFSKQVLKELAT